MSASEQMHKQWCFQHWQSIKPDGVWIVPRSGLTLKKTPTGFDLLGAEPIFTGKRFAKYQKDDFACIQSHFKHAGLDVTDARKILT